MKNILPKVRKKKMKNPNPTDVFFNPVDLSSRKYGGAQSFGGPIPLPRGEHHQSLKPQVPGGPLPQTTPRGKWTWDNLAQLWVPMTFKVYICWPVNICWPLTLTFYTGTVLYILYRTTGTGKGTGQPEPQPSSTSVLESRPRHTLSGKSRTRKVL